jgi:ribose transport system ATP-binding protein
MLQVSPQLGAGANPLLEVRDLTKVYGGTAALAGVDFTVGPGEIHALLGENGAGKSTLVRILAAVDHEDGGSIALAGEPLPLGRTPRSMSDRGVAFIHQDLGLVGSMTVAENIAQYAGYALGRFGISWQATRALAHEALAKLEVDLDPDALVAELSIAEQATVAIVRALALDARLVVLDEPTASLAAGEARRLLEILHRLREAGLSCILVTHRIDDVLTHCDRVTVLRNGTLVGTAHVDDLTQEALIEMIVGDVPLAAVVEHRVRGGERSRLELDGFRGPGFGPVDLDVAPGEIVAVTGFADAGHLKLVDAVFGAAASDGGTVRVDGFDYRPSDPAHALESGIHQVPSDRSAAGLAATLTARENLFPNPAQHELRPVNRRFERRAARDLMDDFDIRPRNCEAQVSVFSGGNAQKLLVARTLAVGPRVLLLCEPTAGVDVGARAVIYAKLRQACAAGLSILMASSDFEEVAGVADRAAVLYRGAVATVLEGDQISVAALTGASYGA